MFEALSEKFSDVFRQMSGRGRISEDNVRESMREVRTALLEADVHYQVVQKFCEDVVANGYKGFRFERKAAAAAE